MKTFKIHFFSDSYIHSGKVDDFGKIYIQLGDYDFPENNWTDFGLNIVFWWMDVFLKLLSGEEKKVQCKFMDGNYRFDVEVTDSQKVWRIFLIREGADMDQIEQEGEIEVTQVTDEVIRVATEIEKLEKKIGKAEHVKNIENFMQRFLSARQRYFVNAQ